MPDADKALGQHMQEKAAQELSGSDSHHLLCAAMRIVLPLKSNALAIESAEAVIRDRDTVRVAAEIAEYLHRAAERRFRINHPAPHVQGPEQLCKLFRIGKDGGRTAAAEFAALP